MRITKEALEEFKAIYQEEFDESLSDEEAYEKAMAVLKFFEVILRPLPKSSDEQ